MSQLRKIRESILRVQSAKDCIQCMLDEGLLPNITLGEKHQITLSQALREIQTGIVAISKQV